MKKTYEMNALLKMIENMSESEQSALAEKIMCMLSSPEHNKSTVQKEAIVVVNEKPNCPYCDAKASMGWIIKKGNCKGSQRFYCKSCARYFVPTTNTTFSHTKKDAETWRKFIHLTIAGKSLKVCSAECGIAYQTAFTWRHKILNAFVVNQKDTNMSGTVEVDEMLFPISYKGNHIKGSFGNRKKGHGVDNGLPRKSFKRGTDNKSMSSKDKACVFCMVEDGGKGYYAGVPGVGFMNPEMLQHTVGKHVNKDTALMLADNYKVTMRYFEENGYRYKTLSSNTSDNPHDHKPEIDGNLHLQHVNSMHRHLRRFLSGYCGVSSKYLENYVALYVWLKSVEQLKKRGGADKASAARAATPDCYITRKAIENRPAVPVCA